MTAHNCEFSNVYFETKANISTSKWRSLSPIQEGFLGADSETRMYEFLCVEELGEGGGGGGGGKG